jgi:hypothetical protein
VIIVVGLEFRSTIQSAQDTIIGWILIATGIGFAGLELTVTATAMTTTTTTTTTTTMTTTTLMSPNTITTGAALTGVSGAKGGRNAECVGWQR